MEVVVIESKAFEKLVTTVEIATARIESVIAENHKLREDHWMSAEEVSQYLGFEKQWVMRRKEEIGCLQVGLGIKFKKSHVDAFCEKHYIIKKPTKPRNNG